MAKGASKVQKKLKPKHRASKKRCLDCKRVISKRKTLCILCQ